jgi:hypothetical protein
MMSLLVSGRCFSDMLSNNMSKLLKRLYLLWIISGFVVASGFAAHYTDHQFQISGGHSLMEAAENFENLQISLDYFSIELQADALSGYIILLPQESGEPFNEGLPSWIGQAEDNSTTFKVYMRFPYNSGWSPWLTVGYWHQSYTTPYSSGYGITSYAAGAVDIDYVKLNQYQTRWQYKVEFKRTNVSIASPSLHRLSFFASDSRTTQELNYSHILNDNPAAIFVPTQFIWQYSVDSEIGGRICSPTSTAMILGSYGIDVDPLAFAWDTYDQRWSIFGVWPRAVQNASQYGLTGAVTRYRNWSDARAVLAQGGRIAMSVGPPLYSGHLMMLAGFDNNGNPLVHDPARSNGYKYKFSKSDLSHSWFDKGGVAYTLYLRDSSFVAIDKSDNGYSAFSPESYLLLSSYPNPFNGSTIIRFVIQERTHAKLMVFNLHGQIMDCILNSPLDQGIHELRWEPKDILEKPLASGIYLIRLELGNGLVGTHKLLYLK